MKNSLAFFDNYKLIRRETKWWIFFLGLALRFTKSRPYGKGGGLVAKKAWRRIIKLLLVIVLCLMVLGVLVGA